MNSASAVSDAPAADARAHRNAFLFLLFIFFVSGAAALIYEVVWTRRLFLILGATSQAISTILTAFMGGLAAGSLIAGRLVDRYKGRNYLTLYAILEAGIGLYGLLTPLLFNLVEGAFLSLLSLVPLSGWPSILVRFVLSLAILIVPTTLMGATLPILSKHIIEHAGHFGRRLGLLYALNTFGAAAGVLLTGFLLLQTFGITGAILYAVVLNWAVAFFAWKMDKLLSQVQSPQSKVHSPASGGRDPAVQSAIENPQSAIVNPPSSIVSHRLVLLLAGLGGAATFLYEVAWTRVLGLVLGGAVQAFCIMLTTFLVGLAFGSFVLSRRIDRSPDLFRFYAWVEGGVAFSALLVLPFFGEMPWVYMRLFPSVYDSYAYLTAMHFAICFALMIVPTFLIGVTFPVVSTLYARDLKTLGTRIGEVYFANTLGGILGSFLAGFVCIPFLGMERTCLVAGVVNAACAALAACLGPASAPRKAELAFGLGFGWLVLLGLYPLAWRPSAPDGEPARAAAAGPDTASSWFWDRRVLTSGVHTYATMWMTDDGVVRPDGGGLRRALATQDLRFYEEGLNAVVTVNANRAAPDILSLQVNGKTDASNATDSHTEVLLGAFPLLMHPDPKDVLVIGLGSGITAGTVTCFPSASAIDQIEIEEAVVHGARLFARDNHDILPDPARLHPGNPRVTLHVEDARFFCALTGRRYDVVISEPSNPWMSGPSHLFTREHFRNLRRVMKEDGLALQWFHTYSMTPPLAFSVLKSFRDVFPHVLLVGYASHPGDLYLFGANRPIAFDVARLKERLALPAVREELERVGFASPAALLNALVLRQEDVDDPVLQNAIAHIPFNDDDFPYVEFEAPRHLHATRSSQNVILGLMTLRHHFLPPLAGDETAVLRELDLCPKLAQESKRIGLMGAALKIGERGLEVNPADAGLRMTVANLLFEQWDSTPPEKRDASVLEKARVHYARVAEADPAHVAAHAQLGEVALAVRKYDDAVRHYGAAAAAGSREPRVQDAMGWAHLQAGRVPDAVRCFEKAIELNSAYSNAHRNLAEAHAKAGAPDRALDALTRWYAAERDPATRTRIRRRLDQVRAGAAGGGPR